MAHSVGRANAHRLTWIGNDQAGCGVYVPVNGARIWLAGFHHPGDTVSAACLNELVRAAEAQTGMRPHRRPELVARRIEAQQAAIERTRRLAARQPTRIDRRYHAEQVEPGPIPAGKRARLRARGTGWHKRLPRLAEPIARAHRVLGRHQARSMEHEVELTRWRTWQALLEADNQANPNPPGIEARMDAEFASGENLTWLPEMGYAPNTKAPNARTTAALCAHQPRGAAWEKVGDNAEMVVIGEHRLRGCPHPLTAAVERFKVGRRFKCATPVRAGQALKLVEWFGHYNARQTIEAGHGDDGRHLRAAPDTCPTAGAREPFIRRHPAASAASGPGWRPTPCAGASLG